MSSPPGRRLTPLALVGLLLLAPVAAAPRSKVPRSRGASPANAATPPPAAQPPATAAQPPATAPTGVPAAATAGARASDPAPPARDAHAAAANAPSAAEVAALEREVRRLRALEGRYRTAERSLLGELEAHGQTLALADRELDLTRTKLARGEKDVQELGLEAAAIEERLAEDRRGLKRALLTSYERKRPDWLVVLLTAESPSSLPRDLQRLTRLSERQTLALTRFVEEQRMLRHTRTLLEGRNAEQRTLQVELEQRRSAAARARARAAVLLSDVEQRKDEAVSELRDAARHLSGLLGGLGRDASAPPPTTGFAAEQGRLPWPAEAPIAKRFGDERHPKFNTLIEHPGIDLGPPPGTTVRAVHAGTVAYADLFKGYGLLVVLDHGDGFYTLYARLADVSVTRGARVSGGTELGRAGSPGALGETGLYFEIRHGEKALDPESWLRRRSGR